jgi:hypothetical protein
MNPAEYKASSSLTNQMNQAIEDYHLLRTHFIIDLVTLAIPRVIRISNFYTI